MNLTGVIVNWRTRDLIKTCVEGLLNCYSNLELVLVDNDSQDGSTDYIRELAEVEDNVSAILNRGRLNKQIPVVGIRETPYRSVLDLDMPTGHLQPKVIQNLLSDGNVGHGPALHQVLKLAKTKYLLALDTDCQILECGFIENMLEPFRDSNVYAVGRIVYLGNQGRNIGLPRGNPHVHEAVIILDVEKYLTLEPYTQYGVPSIPNMIDAVAKGYKLVNFDTERWVRHLFRGSRKRYGTIPHLRSYPIMPEVLLWELDTTYVGKYFEDIIP